MTLANTTSKIRLYINGTDYSDFLIEGSTSDDSAYSTNIITTKGSIVLGGDTSILDYNKTLFPLGSRVNIYATLANSRVAKLPRGQLYVLNSSIDVNTRQTILEVGCSLAYLASREASYQSKIETLITTFISSVVKGSFIIDDYNLSTLQSLLEIEGKVIFQDAYGHIQSLKQFGNDGLGSNLSSAKLTSFDKHTAIGIDSIGGAIEDLPSAILATAEVEVPSSTEEEEDVGLNPPPFVTSQLTRTISLPGAIKGGYNGFFTVRNDPSSDEGGTEAVAGCGTINEPVQGEPSPYAYTAIGSSSTTEYEGLENVTQGRYISYEGPGNQVDFEYDFEYCSAATYAGNVIRSVVGIYVNSTTNEIERSNAILSKANQAYTLRDDYASRPGNPIYTYSNGVVVNTTYTAEGTVNKEAVEYYGCAADQYLQAGRNILEGANNSLARVAVEFADNYTGIYGYSRMQQVFYTYGEGDQIIQKTQLNYIHTASSAVAQKAANRVRVSYRGNARLDRMRYQIADGIDFSSFRVLGKSFDRTVKGDSLLTSHSESKFKNPTKSFNLVLSSKTVTTYQYGSIYNTETEAFTDFEDPSNSYRRVNYSSASGPEEPDRIEYQRDGNGCLYGNDDSSDTENEEIKYNVPVSITNKLGTSSVPISWLGTPGPSVKEVQIPLSFAPIKTKICNGVKTVPDTSATLNTYSQILSTYANNLAKKITADNFGYRITESGTRAEVFAYYPFYPVSLQISSLGKKYKLRVASSNWVFDSDNVLCSFDCFNVGQVSTSSSGPQTTPSVYAGFVKVETTTTLTGSYFNLPQTATSITITDLPAGGTVNLNGSPVTIGTVITSDQINAGNVTFVPSAGGTTTVEIGFEASTSSGTQITSIDGIFPPIQLDLPAYVFADAGDFTNNTTNGGFDGDAGDFDAGTSPGGPHSMNGGDFDTGATVVISEPATPVGASTGNNTVDPELESGISVVDVNDTTISSDTLPAPVGNLDSNFEVIIDFSLRPKTYFRLATQVLPQLGWNYYYITAPLGTAIDMGTIANPNSYTMNFGTITTPIQPVLASSVV
jgi:hypothetical protein